MDKDRLLRTGSDYDLANWVLANNEEHRALLRLRQIDAEVLEALKTVEGRGDTDSHRGSATPLCVAATWVHPNGREPFLSAEYLVGPYKIELQKSSISRLWIPDYSLGVSDSEDEGDPEEETNEDGYRWHTPFTFEEIRILFPKVVNWQPAIRQYWEMLAVVKITPHPMLCEECLEPFERLCFHVQAKHAAIEKAQ